MLGAIGAAIQSRRRSAGLSQDGFADQIGMHRAYYGKVERGQKNLTIGTLLRICEGLQVKPSELLLDASI